MKRLKSTVIYHVPSWNFCNSDILVNHDVGKETCRFCIKTRNGYECLLHNQQLTTFDELINKAPTCKRATAGDRATIIAEYEPQQQAAVQPKELIKHTIETYNKTLNELLKQGYPRALAEKLATQHTIGGN